MGVSTKEYCEESYFGITTGKKTIRSENGVCIPCKLRSEASYIAEHRSNIISDILSMFLLYHRPGTVKMGCNENVAHSFLPHIATIPRW